MTLAPSHSSSQHQEPHTVRFQKDYAEKGIARFLPRNESHIVDRLP